MRIGMGIDLVPGCGAFTSGSSYEAEATALFARFGTDPGTTRKDAINTCIASLKSGGVWSKLDCLYVFAAHAEADAKLNWISTSDNLTENGTLGFTTDVGFDLLGTSATDYLATTSLASELTYFTQNSAHISIWTTSTGATGNAVLSAGSSGINLFTRFDDGNTYMRVNDNPEAGGFSVANGTGFYLGNRSSSTAREGYKNASSVGSYGSVSSQARNAAVFKFGNGAASNTMHAASIGGSLTSGEVTSFYNALNTLKTAIGW